MLPLRTRVYCIHGMYSELWLISLVYDVCLYIRYWVLDPARLVIFVVSLLLITLGSKRAVYLDKNCTEAEAEGALKVKIYQFILYNYI